MSNLNLKIKAFSADASKKLNDVKSNMSSLGRATKKTDKDFAGLYKQTKKTNNSFNNLTKDANRTNKAFGTLSKTVVGASKVFNLSTASAYLFARVLDTSINATMDMIETTNLFNVSMGDMATSTQELVESMSELSGLDTTNIQSAVGTFSLLARSMGISSKNAQVLAVNSQKLAVDLSSLTNVEINQVMQDLRSGLVGQSEAVYKYGIDITEASLKQEALNLGITKSVRNMSQGEKLMLRYSVMLKQTGLSHGDFAKTINTPANQLRILKERVVTLSRSFGSIFMPALEKILPYLNAFTQFLIVITDKLAQLVGFKPPEIKDTENSFSGIEEGADDATKSINGTATAMKKLNNYAMGFDELNVISPQTDSGGAGGGDVDSGAFDLDLNGYDNLMSTVSQKSDEILVKIQTVANAISEALSPLSAISFDNLIMSLQNLWLALFPFVEAAGTGLWEGFKFFISDILAPLGEWTIETAIPTLFNEIAKALQFLSSTVSKNTPNIKSAICETFDFMANIIKLRIEDIKQGFDLLIEIFTSLYEKCIKPIVSKIVENVFPILHDGVMFVFDTILLIYDKLRGIIKDLCDNIIYPAVEFVTNIIGDLFDILGDFWEKHGKQILRKIQEAISKTSDLIKHIVNNVLSPIISKIVKTLTWLWENHLKQLVAHIVDAIGEIAEFIMALYNDCIVPVINWIIDNVIPRLAPVFDFIIEIVAIVFSKVSDVISKIIDIIKNIIKFITGVFTGDWKKAWEGVVGVFSNVFEGIGGILKAIMNGVIDTINSAIGFIIKGVNKLIESVEWLVGKVGINLNLTPIQPPQIPRLARGGILERGQLFEAGEYGKSELVGSYQGKTTVMPLEDSGFVEAIYNAVYSALSNSSNTGGTIVENIVTLDGEVIYKNQNKVAQERGHNFGLGAFAR